MRYLREKNYQDIWLFKKKKSICKISIIIYKKIKKLILILLLNYVRVGDSTGKKHFSLRNLKKNKEKRKGENLSPKNFLFINVLLENNYYINWFSF